MAKNDQNFNIGDTVWYERDWIERAVILEIDMESAAGVPMARLKTSLGTVWQPMSILYKSEQAGRDAAKAESERIRNEYRKKINSVEDLVIFLFNNDTSGCEYSDYDARAVAIEKAAELLNMSETRLLGMEPEGPR